MATPDIQLPRWAWFFLAGIILIGVVIFWSSDLDVDPPMYFVGLGQSLSTDPAQYVYHARNAILFNDWDPFDYSRWTVYQHSLTSLVAYVWMSLTEPSLANANTVGVILSLAGMLLLALVFWRRHSSWTVPTVILLFGLNGIMFTYGRLSYLENGVVFLGALTFLVYTFWGRRLAGVALAGAVAAAAMLVGKLFGALLLPVIVLAVLTESQPDKWRKVIATVAGFIVMSVVLILALYAGDWTAAFGYVAEQSYGLRGFPQALTSPILFVEKLITYGVVNRVFERSPDLLLMLAIAAALLAFYWGRGGKLRDLPRTSVFAFWWIVVCWVGLMALNYSPTRYFLTVLPAILIIALSLLDWLTREDRTLERPTRPAAFIPVLLVLWVASANIIGRLFLFGVQPAPIGKMTWFGLIVALALTTAWWLFNQKQEYVIGRRVGTIAAVVMVALAIGVQSMLQISISRIENYNLKEASIDVERILGEDAVLSGPYAAVMGLENNLPTFIHLFGVANVDTSLFDRYPITHIAAESNNWQLATRDYPLLADVAPVASYWIRDIEVAIYPIWDRFENARANAYQPSYYELAVAQYTQNNSDSAFTLIDAFEEREPVTKIAGPLYATMLYQQDRGAEVVEYLGKLADRYPTDFSIQLRCGQFFQILGLTNQRQDFMMQAQALYNRAMTVNPHRTNTVIGTYQATMQQYGAPQPPPTAPTQPPTSTP